MPRTAAQMVADAKATIRNLTPAEAQAEQDGAVFVDIREPEEWERDGVIPGAVLAPRGMLEFWADPSSPYHRDEFDPGKRVILYCASGGRSALAAVTLRELGYTDVAHVDGGIQAWKETGLPVTDETR